MTGNKVPHHQFPEALSPQETHVDSPVIPLGALATETTLGPPAIFEASGSIPISAADRQHVLADIESKRSAILDLPSHEEGLNMDRVREYGESMGVPIKPVKVLSSEDYDAAMAILDMQNPGENFGRHIPDINLTVVRRDPEAEAINGPEITESWIVHEMAHGSEEHVEIKVQRSVTGRFIKKTNLHYKSHHSGLLANELSSDEPARGLFLEEGYADYERGLYVKHVLGRPNGFAAEPEEELDRSEVPFIPGEYWFLGTNTDTGEAEPFITGKSAFAAAAIGLLIDNDPDLLPAFRKARSSDEGLAEVKERIDAVSPGLYDDLMNVEIGNDHEGLVSAMGGFQRVSSSLAQTLANQPHGTSAD